MVAAEPWGGGVGVGVAIQSSLSSLLICHLQSRLTIAADLA